MSEQLTQDDLSQRRLAACVEAWPECWSGDYNPACCRFPKSCSPHGYIEAVQAGNLTDADLEPAKPEPEPPSPERMLRGSLINLEVAIAHVDMSTTALKEVEDFDTVLELLAEATRLQGKLKAAVGSIHDRAWALRGEVYGDHHHPDLGVVSVRRTANRPRWDHETTAERVVQQHVEAAGGEVPGDPAVVVGWLLEAGALSYWRKGVLKSLGIDVKGEDLFWSEPGSPTITFPSMSGK